MVLVAPGTGHDVDHAAGCASEFGLVAAALHVDVLDGVEGQIGVAQEGSLVGDVQAVDVIDAFRRRSARQRNRGLVAAHAVGDDRRIRNGRARRQQRDGGDAAADRDPGSQLLNVHIQAGFGAGERLSGASAADHHFAHRAARRRAGQVEGVVRAGRGDRHGAFVSGETRSRHLRRIGAVRQGRDLRDAVGIGRSRPRAALRRFHRNGGARNRGSGTVLHDHAQGAVGVVLGAGERRRERRDQSSCNRRRDGGSGANHGRRQKACACGFDFQDRDLRMGPIQLRGGPDYELMCPGKVSQPRLPAFEEPAFRRSTQVTTR